MSKNRQRKIERHRKKRSAFKKEKRAEQLRSYLDYKDVVWHQYVEIFESFTSHTPAEFNRALRLAWRATRKQEGIKALGTRG